MSAAVLSVRELTCRFGGLAALAGVSFDVPAGSITAIIGPNGAGKTTLFNVVTGLYEPTAGEILFDGVSLAGVQPDVICRRGIARTFQNIRLFAGMTVLQNVLVGMHTRAVSGSHAGHGANLFSAFFHLPSHRELEREHAADARRLLDFVGLAEYAGEVAANLPYGSQRRLEIARALASGPKLALLDEPAAGLTPAEKVELKGLVRGIRDQGVTVILIEHDMKFVMDISDTVVVLDYGKKIAEGKPDQVRRDPDVIEAYLGSSLEPRPR